LSTRSNIWPPQDGWRRGRKLVINPNTVARAYLELERAGIVIKRQGAGTYIADVSSPLSRRGKFKLLKQRADALLVEADHLGIGLSEVVELVQECHETMHKQEPQP
jgi:GntR family transcriptional regulator